MNPYTVSRKVGAYKELGNPEDYGDAPGNDALSGVPLKLDMTDPKNQRDAQASWNRYRAQVGQPAPLEARMVGTSANDQKRYQGSVNMARITDDLHSRFVGWPDEAIRQQIISDEGLSPDQAGLLPYAQAPREVKEQLDAGAPVATYGPNTYLGASSNPQTLLGTLAHETVHSWGNVNRPGFHPAPGQNDVSQYNDLGEQPFPHFPDSRHDRGMVDALSAQKRALKYGGYPKDIRPASPWPMARTRSNQ